MENDEPPAEARHDVSPAKREPPSLDEAAIAADVDARVAQQMEERLIAMGAIKKY